ncbi:hypothetical protein HDU91_003721 [Kappamyces sp. JEL0680]|nr:hypothetical protein HDU91_003721 [Kappamyces sp. JEL0680]
MSRLNPLHTKSSLENLSAISPGLKEILSPVSVEENDNLNHLDLGQLFQWILGFSIVNFDLESGHVLEHTYPPIPYSEQERRTLAFTQNLYLKQTLSDDFNVAKSSGLPIDTDGFTYGHVFFRQQRDLEVKRGFFQKALVLLTPHPWHGLFSFIVSKMGPVVMNALVSTRTLDSETPNGVQDVKSVQILEKICFEIASWPSPPFSWSSEQCFESMVLPLSFMDSEYLFAFPPNNLFPQLYPTKSRSESAEEFEKLKYLLCSPGRFYQLFGNSLESLWTCWELMVLGEPIYVVSDVPSSASQIVQSLVELIKPIPFGGDYRPYFTIQDSDFPSLASKNRSPPQATVLGVTNRVFSKVLEHWPHRITTSREKKPSVGMDFLNLESLSLNGIDFYDSGVEKCSFKHKNYLSKDRKLLKAILEVGVNVKGVDSVNNTIRRHFLELSERFLQPLNRYFDSLVVGSPQEMNLSKLRPYPEIRPFKRDSFMQRIDQSVPSLPLQSKRPLAEFYDKFLMSPNFASWLSHKTSSAYRNWRNYYLKLLANADIEYWIESRLSDSIVECIDLMMRLKEEIARYASFFIVEGGDVRTSYSSAKPAAKPKPLAAQASCSSEAEMLGRNASGSLERGYAPAYHDLDFDEEVDLTTLSTTRPKHLKAKTTPISSVGRSSSPFSSTHEVQTSDETEATVSLASHDVRANLSTLVPKNSSKSLRGIGDFIPPPDLYRRLLEQLDLIIRLLPAELTLRNASSV